MISADTRFAENDGDSGHMVDKLSIEIYKTATALIQNPKKEKKNLTVTWETMEYLCKRLCVSGPVYSLWELHKEWYTILDIDGEVPIPPDYRN